MELNDKERAFVEAVLDLCHTHGYSLSTDDDGELCIWEYDARRMDVLGESAYWGGHRYRGQRPHLGEIVKGLIDPDGLARLLRQLRTQGASYVVCADGGGVSAYQADQNNRPTHLCHLWYYRPSDKLAGSWQHTPWRETGRGLNPLDQDTEFIRLDDLLDELARKA